MSAPIPPKSEGYVVVNKGQRVGATESTKEAADQKAATVRQTLNESPAAPSAVKVVRQLNG